MAATPAELRPSGGRLGTRRLARAAGLAASTYTRTAGGQRAAAISYHVLFSLVPFLAVLVSVAELLLPETTQERVVSWIVGLVPLPEDMGPGVEGAVRQAGPPATLAGVVALAGLIWAASGMMASVRSAFRAVWATEAARPYVRSKLLDIALVLAAGLFLISAFGVSVVVQIATEASTRVARDLGGKGSASEQLGSLTEIAASTALALGAFLLLYRVVPPTVVRLRDALPGAVVAAVGFGVASAGFSIYLDRFADFDDLYGPLGTVLAFLMLVYVAAAIMLFGACLAAAWPQAAEVAPSVADPDPLRIRIVRALRGLMLRSGRPS